MACIPANAAIDAHDDAEGAATSASIADANAPAFAAASRRPRCDTLQWTVSHTITAFIWFDCQTVECTAQAAVSCGAALLLPLYISQLCAMHTFIPHAMTCQMRSQQVASHTANMLTPMCLMCAAETA